MPGCPACARELRPEWKFCIFCGTPVAAPVRAPAVAPAPTLVVTPPPASRPPTTSLRTRSHDPAPRRRINPLAIAALVLGCLASPLAAVFGHLALVQLAATRERGRIPAIAAIVLGYGSLAFIAGLGILSLTIHA